MKKTIIGLTLVLGVLGADAALARSERPVIAVAEFTNESAAAWWRGGVGWELAGMLSNELSSTGDFTVVERSKVESVLAEQNLAASGRVRPGTGAKIGRLTGAEYLIAGTVTAYEEDTQGTGGGIAFKGIGLGGSSQKAYLAIDLRVINATTGEIEFSRTIEGTSKSSSIAVGVSRGGFSGALASQKKTPAGKAIRAALVEITDYLGCEMVHQDGCEAEYQAKEAKRREKTRGALDLD